MADQDKEKQLDDLLDSLLSQYADAEPRPGLETSVLTTIRQARSAKEVRWMGLGWWAVGAVTVVMTAALIAFSFYGGRSHPAKKQIQRAAQQRTIPAPKGDFGPGPAIGRSVKHARRQVHLAEVKKEVFPTPAPLSQQEKLLLRYLAGTPRQEVQAQSHPDPPPDDVAFANDSGLFSSKDSNRSIRSNQ
ncbi:MAG TPA: hypothetical protein VJ848_08770 [Candidatus Angelobacter sp.]|nr:hypothetical protein [Candidatus Angelobacter sp.]